jgi:alkaline phosphatase
MKNLSKFISIILLVISISTLSAQEGYKDVKAPDSLTVFINKYIHETINIGNIVFSPNQKPKNIILFIGDGMGVAQVFGGLTANGGKLNITNFPITGFSMTQSADNYVTDSGAGGTAIACGVKTNNGSIGVDEKNIPVKSLIELAETAKLSTGIVVTCALSHATPASFVSHVKSRKYYEEIAAGYVNSGIDVFIGGGLNDFAKRKDKRNLVEEIKLKNYNIAYNLDELDKIKSGNIAAFLDTVHLPKAELRNEMLTKSVAKAISILKNNDYGFFMMVEGSQIDWGGHQNNTAYIERELLDMDKAVGEALKFALEDKNTLIIITADHETGGMTLSGGNIEKGKIVAKYTSDDHSGIPVPVFAFGPGAENFSGVYQNTELFKKIVQLLDLKN